MLRDLKNMHIVKLHPLVYFCKKILLGILLIHDFDSSDVMKVEGNFSSKVSVAHKVTNNQ